MSFADFEQSARGNVRMDIMRWGYKLHAQLGRDGIGNLGRFLQRVFAKAALGAAAALWVLPGSNLGLDVVAMKGGVSVGLIILAVVWLRASRKPAPEVHIDRIKQEIRVVERVGRRAHLKKHYSFAQIGRMYVQHQKLHLHDAAGKSLTVLALDPASEARMA